MASIDVGCTVGSLAVCYGDIFGEKGRDRRANLFINCYEKDYIFVFSFDDR